MFHGVDWGKNYFKVNKHLVKITLSLRTGQGYSRTDPSPKLLFVYFVDIVFQHVMITVL